MADVVGSQPTGPGAEPAEPRSRSSTIASKISGRVRSLSKGFEASSPPAGFMAATSEFASSAVVGDAPRRNSGAGIGTPPRRQTFTEQSTEPVPRESAEYKQNNTSDKAGGGEEEEEQQAGEVKADAVVASSSAEKDASPSVSDEVLPTVMDGKSQDIGAGTEAFDNGYHFPPSYPKREAFKHGLVSFLRYSITPMGFCVVLYGLNVVAWGGMLFLLLCNAAPAMCYPSCNDINSPRRVWIEYDSQVLTALFSLTAFGLAPWRFRDSYYLMMYRLRGQQDALRQLAGIHRDWFRLPGSSSLPVDIGPENAEGLLAQGQIPKAAVAIPASKMPDPPLTAVRAPPTKVWKLDFVIWMMVWNTLFQCVLSGVMWGMNRYTRPSWSTGLFVALGCIVAAIGGLTMFLEGKKVKSIEGVPLSDRDRERLARDKELGIAHYNNIKDRPLIEEAKGKKKEKKTKK